MSRLQVITSLELFNHLNEFEVDGATVGSVLFEGGRLCYPNRGDIEHQLGYTEPYTLALESRIIVGLDRKCEASVRYLSAIATESHDGHDLTLDLLWASHRAFCQDKNQIALDRLVAALVTIEDFRHAKLNDAMVNHAASTLIMALYAAGLPPTRESLEEIFDGADPACLGLGLVEL